MKKGKLLGSALMMGALALTLAACGQSSNNAQQAPFKDWKISTPAKPAKKGGSVKVAVETDTPFTGIFNDELSSSGVDTEVSQYGSESLFSTDDHYKINNSGAATLKIDRAAKTITINIKPNVKWSDGQPVTAKDYEYAYEIIGNKATNSQRYSTSLEDLVGFKEYHEGKASTISGLEMPDGESGRKVVLHMQQMKPGMKISGNGYFWETAAPYHYLKDVPFSKLISSDKVRKHPLYFGAYRVTKVVRGQSVTWKPNKYYYKGKPKLSKITCSVISPNSVAQSIKSGKFDVAEVITSQWPNISGAKGVRYISTKTLGYTYLGFKVGKWKNGQNVMNNNSKMNNRALRQAIAYGMNVNQVAKRYSYGLTFRVPTLIPDQFGAYHDSKIKGYSYNIKKANKILDKAGYKKKGTYRVQPNGKPLTIHFMAMSGSSTQEPIIQNYIQQWKKMGLHVVLTGGRLTEFNSFYDKLQNDAKGVDMFQGVWGLSSEPSVNDLYGRGAQFNYSRYATKKNDELIAAMDSQKSFSTKYRVKKFHEWQEYMNKEAYVVPVSNHYTVMAVNNKLTGYSLRPSKSMNNGWPNWYYVGYAK
ncbi:MAG: oligopeptide ABC transporter substrate-binding protein [Lactobacillus sp.]|jgi:peptide/nickel transport system substrate-binding protein|nr:oligopeptide ABC transporter substrate-binding protein [Lactobacillus sp.]